MAFRLTTKAPCSKLHLTASLIGVLLSCLALGTCDSKSTIRGGLRSSAKPVTTIGLSNLNRELDTALDEALGQGHGVDQVKLKDVESQMNATFESLHKNRFGRIELNGLRYLMQRYFAKGHGWRIKGFERETASTSDAESLIQKLPGYVESVLEAKLNHHGFDLADAVTMAISLERMIFDAGLEQLEQAVNFNTMPDGDEQLIEAMRSYLLMYTKQLEGEATQDRSLHQRGKAHILDPMRNLPLEFQPQEFADAEVNLAIWQRKQANPFANEQQKFSFREAAKVADRITEDFGRFQNDECSVLRDGLIHMDPKGNGRIPLKEFTGKRVHQFVFLEPENYLRELGVLDESDPAQGAQVVIPNYVSSLSNCVETSDFYSVCCLDPCSGVMQSLEGEIRAPTATVDQLITAMASVTTDSVEEPRNLTRGTPLRNLLEEVGEASDGGEINLHGRLLAQWLHYAFPHECPLPAHSDVAKPKTVSEYNRDSQHLAQEHKIDYKAAGAVLDITEEVKAAVEKKESGAAATSPDDQEEILLGDTAAQNSLREEKTTRQKMPSAWSLEEELFTAAPSRRSKSWLPSGQVSLVGLVILGLILGKARLLQTEKTQDGGLIFSTSSPTGRSSLTASSPGAYIERVQECVVRACSSPTSSSIMKRRSSAGGPGLPLWETTV